MTPIEASYRTCRHFARRAASNFYYAFWRLPPDKRRAMCALYAFFRRTDDLSDNDSPPAERGAQLRAWRDAFTAALAGECRDPLLPALVDTLQRYQIPPDYLYEAIAGAEMDLAPTHYETFADLEAYCYRAASVVGLACIHVWGFDDERALAPAVTCGTAFQLTNILRDLAEDARRGRIYLPREDLRRFDYTEDDLRSGRRNGQFAALLQYQVERAERCYCDAAALERRLSRDGKRVFGLMFATYRMLLEEIERCGADVLTRRVRLGSWRKLQLLTNASMGRLRIASRPPQNGPNRGGWISF